MKELIVTYSRSEYIEMLTQYLNLCVALKTKNALKEIEAKMYLASKLDEFKFEVACEFAKTGKGSILNWFPAIYSSIAIYGNNNDLKTWMHFEFERFKMQIDGFTRVGTMSGSIPQSLMKAVEEYKTI